MQDPTARALELADIADALVALLEEETDRLSRPDLPKIDDLQERKTALMSDYERYSAEFRASPALFEAVAPEERAELQDCLAALNAAAEDNALALESAMTANHLVMQVLGDALRDIDLTPGYGRGGTSGLAPVETVSLRLDERL